MGLVQKRIKRLFAYSTISHLGFMLLAITINRSESIQAFVFYITQYSMSNLNAFLILIAIGYTLYPFIKKSSEVDFYQKKLYQNVITGDLDLPDRE